MNYQNTSLWKRTLGLDNEYVKPLRDSFLDARKNAEFLLDKIRKDFPNLTVHDITHVDSLWNVADTIIGKDYDINPLEGYVLGVAFLIHDAALSYETVGGKDVLRETIQWKDAFAVGPGDKDLEEFKKECDFEAIRAIHAIKAGGLLEEKFYRDNGTTFYIVNEDSYRKHYGEWIGKIAASHHWDIDRVESELETQINPMPDVPGEWEINAQKLACILRCADAGHIDNGRAPDTTYFYHSLGINGVSLQHWKYQNRLGQVRQDKDNPELLRITSVNSFKKDDFAAWNVAYDAIRMFDAELKKSNALLKDIQFPHTGVAGANSKEALSKYVKTVGWEPCDFGVHTSNVKKLIENLGGSKLYGNKNLLLVTLRELIQNARDAIHARSTIDECFKEAKITIRLKEEAGKRQIEVEDNGIGMSENCIKYHLLDFGSSYWKSSLVKYENPGLKSKGFKSVGKFGIGFYSVFMVSKSVEVITKRYDKGVNDAKSIEFPEGLTLSPILSKSILSPNVSTIVRFELKDDVDIAFNVQKAFSNHSMPLSKILSVLTVGLDADVYFEKHGIEQRIHSNVKSISFDKKEWLGGLFIDIPENIDELASQLEKLTDERGVHRGWIISPEWIDKIVYPKHTDKDFASELFPSIATIGGLMASLDVNDSYSKYGYIGYVDGVEDGINRNKMILDGALKKCLQSWAIKKYRENYENIISSSSLSILYSRLIDSFCQMSGMVIKDNERLFYSTYRHNNEIGTIQALFIINRYLLSGVVPHLIYPTDLKLSSTDFEMLFDSSVSNSWKDSTLKTIFETCSKMDRDLIERLMQIDKLPSSNYHEIIHKFYMVFNTHGLLSIHNIAPSVWVNLLLNERCHTMIDWRKVSLENLFKIKDKEDELSSYLEQFLSSSYLTEIISSKKDII